MSEKVILIIKVANQGSVDQKIECELDSTILHLKEEISQCHPTKPTVGEQRLIYSGQLLQDSLTLRTILRHPSDNNEYIIHMVCSTTRTIPVNRFENSNVTTSSQLPSSGNSSNDTESNTEGLRHRIAPSEQQIPALGVQQGFDTSVYSTLPQFPLPQAVNDPIQQMAIMQQMYAQYMASYMQYIQYGGVESERLFQDPNSAASLSSSASTNVNGENQENNTIAPPQNPNIEQEQRNAQGRLNQGRGPADEVEEEMGARDWLDYLYFGSRMLILLSIVYFYSTLTRFIIVSGISFFIYMYQRGGARARRDRGDAQPQEQGNQPQAQNANNEGGPNGAQPNADAPIQPGPEGAANRDGGAGSNARQEAALTGEGTRRNDENINEELRGRREETPGLNEVENDQPTIPNPTREEVSPPQPSLLALSWTFLTTFFTSLIPEQHQIV